MKLKHLLAMALFAVAGSAWGQTDVTSTYLTNADFERTYSVQTLLNGGDRAIYKPDGWTVTRENGNQYDLTALNSNCLAWNNFSAKAQLATGGNNTYWIRIKNGTPKLKLTQEVTLPAGSYTFSADAYKNGTGGEHYLMANGKEVSLSGNEDSWRKLSIDFVLLQETTVTLGFRYQHNSSGSEKFIAFDNFKLIANYIADATESNPVNITPLVGTAKSSWTGATEEGAAIGSDGASINRVSKYSEQHFTGDVMSQTINNLPLGKYSVEYYANANCAAHKCTAIPEADGATDRTVFYANDASAGVPILNDGKSLPDGKMTLRSPLVTTVKDGTLTLKLVNEQQGANWISVQIKSLNYLGIDLQIWNDAKTAAQAALDNYNSKYATTERQAVVDAMNAANPTTVAALESQVNDLNTKVATYIKKADNEILMEQKAGLVAAIARIKTEYPNSSDAVLNPDISKWTTSTYKANNGTQHWSGNTVKYYEQSLSNPDMWAQNSWSIAAEQNVNLPAGKYAFVVTARGSADVDSKMTIDGQEVVLSTNGDTGYGVATDGECTYDMNKTYTNGGIGRGWEYAYAEFEVTEAKNVTFRLESSTEKIHNWVSIANPVLYYNDDAKAEMEKINAKAELNNALLAVTAKPAENIGNGAFQYSQANVDAYQGVIDAAQAVYDDAESTTQNFVDAKATLDNIQYPALNAPDAEQAYKMVQNSLSLNPETNTITSIESAVWFEAATGGYKIKSNTDKYIKYEGSNNWTMTTTDDANSAAVFAVEYTATKGLTFKGSKGLYGGDADTDGATMYGNKGTGNKVYWSVSDVEMAEDYTALNSAITTAEAKALGFENGEYAPYNNIEALNALAAAKAINKSIPNTKDAISKATTALTSATWTANDGDVAIVYNGDMLEMDGTSPKGWNGAGWGAQENAVDGKKVYYYNSGRTVQYGVVEGYTMPLKAHTVYQLTYSYGSQGNNSCKGLPVSVKLGDNVIRSYESGAFGTLYGTGLKTVTFSFVTTEAGNYTLNFGYNGNVGITDISLVKGIYRTSENGQYGTLCLPYDFNATGAQLYTITGIENGEINLTEAGSTVAGQPYIYCATADKQTFVPVNNEDLAATPTDNAYLVGSFKSSADDGGLMTVPQDAYVLQTQNEHQGFFKVTSDDIKCGLYKCYLKSDAPGLNSRSAFFFGGDETAIEALDALTSGKAVIYDLNGRKLNKLQKGINIVNGTKIIVK